MKKTTIYLVTVIFIFIGQTVFCQSFYEQYYDQDPAIRKQNLQIQGQYVTANNWQKGDEFTFNTQIIPEIACYPGNIKVYMKLDSPTETTIYQLDHVPQNNTKNGFLYSCRLILTQTGEYQFHYFSKNLNNETFTDNKTYKFNILQETKND